MKWVRFFGGVYFAAFLIATLAVAVIAATFVESHYESHEAAVELVYRNPLFNLLLGGFFLNILVSALRRWPFQKKHIPFLLTHLGLLMVIGGTVVKNIWGIQGNLRVIEGSSNNTLYLSGTQALHIDDISYPIKKSHWDHFTANGMDVSLKSYLPHATLEYIPMGYVVRQCSDLKQEPALSVECREGEKKEKICLHFSDPYRWPILGHLISFKEHTLTIPHTVRLRQARKICYPGTNNPSAYEADVWIDDQFFTLKMNEVYESPLGYRFYLSSMSDPPFDSKQIHVVVNYDPVRSSLTYPGAFLVVLGATLLFFRKKV